MPLNFSSCTRRVRFETSCVWLQTKEGKKKLKELLEGFKSKQELTVEQGMLVFKGGGAQR